MNWDYRVTFRNKSEVPTYYVREVYYNDDWEVVLYSKDPSVPSGDIPDELYEDHCMMMKAFDQPPLNLDYIDYLIEVRKQNDERKSNTN